MTKSRPTASPERPGNLRAISMATHIHASFSEGIGSYEAHLQQARAHGVDVIWWTDHDFRVAAHGYRHAVRFDGVTETEGGLEWQWTEQPEGTLADARAEFVAEPRSPDEPGGALRLAATGGPGGGALWLRGTAFNWTYSVSLADTTLELDVLAEQTAPGAVLAVAIESSYHPARDGRPAGQYHLRYHLGGTDQRRQRTDGLTGIIELPSPAGQWHRHALRPVDDIARLWPELVAADNALHQLRIGVLAAEDTSASVVVDRLRFHRGRGQGPSALQLRREVLAHYAQSYPDVTWYEAFEVSLVRHLNWLGGALELPELPLPPLRDNDVTKAVAMVEFMQQRGAVVQWNHPLDVETPESLARLMIERDNLGADLVEIGREHSDGLLRTLDLAARNAVFFTAVGVTDDHVGDDWLRQRSNWLTYVWAASTGQADLLAALRAGRAWFLNPARWRGELDLWAWRQPAMGAVAVTRSPAVPLRLRATDLPPGAAVDIIVGQADQAGVDDLVPACQRTRVSPDDLAGGWYEWSLDPGDGRYLRAEVVGDDGVVIGVSNPLWLLRREPPRGVPAARRLR